MSNVLLLTQQYFRQLFSLVIGAFGTLAFSPYDIWPAAIFSLSGLLTVTLNCGCNKAWWMGFIWGVGLFGSGINWIGVSITQYSGLPSWTSFTIVMVLIGYLALYPAFFSALLAKLWPKTTFYRLTLGSPVLWSITEFLRSWILGGFPWLEFGYTQIDGPLKGIAALFGVQAITFILMMISGTGVFAIVKQKKLAALWTITLLVLPCPLNFLQWYQLKTENTINISLVQGNIIPSIKWEYNQIISILDIYLQQTLKLKNQTKIFIWPESAIPNKEGSQNMFLTWLDKKLKQKHIHLITGIIDTRPTLNGYNYYNSIAVFGEHTPYSNTSHHHYSKHHLVPFSETVPLKNIFLPLASLFNLPVSLFSQGGYLQPQLQVSGIKFTATICYEIIFGGQVRDNFRPDTDFLLTLSNDAWFGYSIGPWQHFQMARMRAVELGRPLLHSTNNGITAVISASGKIQAQLPQFTRDVLSVYVVPAQGTTPYAYFGSWPLWGIVLLVYLTALILDQRQLLKSSS